MSTDVDAGRSGLDLGDSWTRRWAVSWRAGGDDASCSVHDLVQEPVLTSDPMRHFTWCRDQKHRPGLQFLTSTGRHHGAESLEESRVLLALDFAGDVVDVVSQPLKISFATCGKRRAHTPDYLAVTRRGVWLIDVRPEPLIKESDRESFAAAAEVAVACGWRYVVAARWREHAFAGLDAMASRRRLRFGELAAANGLRAGRPGPAAAPAVVPAAGRRPGRPAWGPLSRDARRGGGPVTAAAVLDLSPGAGLVLDGTEWTVERREPHLGRVQLVKDDGIRERMTFRFLANHPQCRPSSRTAAAGADRGRQRKASEDLKAGGWS